MSKGAFLGAPATPADADAEELLARSRRPLVLGIGGGGDVVGAAAIASLLEVSGARPVVGGTSWERRVVDPRPGPRSAEEIVGAVRRPAPAVLVAGPATRVAPDGERFAEARVAEALGQETVIVDVTRGPRSIAGDLAIAARELDWDLLLLVDVGGDALATGAEPGLASPLCDAVMLAAGNELAAGGDLPVLAGVFGAGCDGELTPAEVLDRLSAVARAEAFIGARGLTRRAAERLAELCAAVPTEASAQALACFRGARDVALIRGGLRRVERTPLGALCFLIDLARAFDAGALPLARAVAGAADLEAANRALLELGVRTELEFERRSAAA